MLVEALKAPKGVRCPPPPGEESGEEARPLPRKFSL